MKPVSKHITIPSMVTLPTMFFAKHSYISGPIRTPLMMNIEDIEITLREEIAGLVMFETINVDNVWQAPVELTLANFDKTYTEICAENGIQFDKTFYTEDTSNQAPVYEAEETPAEVATAMVETPVVVEEVTTTIAEEVPMEAPAVTEETPVEAPAVTEETPVEAPTLEEAPAKVATTTTRRR